LQNIGLHKYISRPELGLGTDDDGDADNYDDNEDDDRNRCSLAQCSLTIGQHKCFK